MRQKRGKKWTPRDDPMRIVSQWTTDEWREYHTRLEKAGKNDVGNELLTNSIDDTEDIIRRVVAFNISDKRAAASQILDVLRVDAKKHLKRIDSEKCPTPFASSHAFAVLSYADRVRGDIEKNDAAQTMLDMFVLISSTIALSGWDLINSWIMAQQVLDGIEVSHTKGKLHSVALAIEDVKRENPTLEKGREPIWTHLKKLWREGHPWSGTTEDGTRHAITFKGEDRMIVTVTDKKGETKASTLTKRTFKEKYLAKKKPTR